LSAERGRIGRWETAQNEGEGKKGGGVGEVGSESEIALQDVFFPLLLSLFSSPWLHLGMRRGEREEPVMSMGKGVEGGRARERGREKQQRMRMIMSCMLRKHREFFKKRGACFDWSGRWCNKGKGGGKGKGEAERGIKR
jgi:hypothetical protein